MLTYLLNKISKLFSNIWLYLAIAGSILILGHNSKYIGGDHNVIPDPKKHDSNDMPDSYNDANSNLS